MPRRDTLCMSKRVKLAVEQLREAERKKAEAVMKSMDLGASVPAKEGACDQVADCCIYTTIHHY